MRLGHCLALIAFTLVGCGSSEVESVQPSEAQKVSVIDNDGQRKMIALNELFDDETGDPLVSKVYCMDRRNGKKVWVDPKALKQRDPTSSYFVPIRE